MYWNTIDALTCLSTGSETHKPVDPVCGESIDLHLLADGSGMLDPLQQRQGSVKTKAVPDNFVKKRTLRRWQDGNFRKASALPAELVDADYLSAIPDYRRINISGIVTDTSDLLARFPSLVVHHHLNGDVRGFTDAGITSICLRDSENVHIQQS
ncbi:hypothetical protein B0H10DRAFT_1967189 [Mycena sp. CBHHK59/15]|nr:hypothetical protein B0H10DRAFT_1967189 [Mycena sp. CBHHK59/15]